MSDKFARSRLRWRFLLSLFAIALISGVILSGAIAVAKTPLAGGETTVFNRSSRAYEQPSVGLNEEEEERHFQGDLAFDAVFVTPPAHINPGLGPLFNNASCTGCHIRNGRGLPEKGQLLVRVSDGRKNSGDVIDPKSLPVDTYHLEASVSLENAPPVPGLGTQIQDRGIYGHEPEATVEIAWEEREGKYKEGTPYSLRYPRPEILLPNGESLSPDILTSLRIPPPVFGLGLLEAVPEATIRNLADPDDRDGDGISGRVNEVWDVEKEAIALGRFGWKANNPNLLQQTASAYVNDMGVTNPLFPESDEEPDIDRQTLEEAEFYAQTLAVPGRILLNDPEIQQGEKLFEQAECASCHIPTLSTGDYEIEALAHQTIHPYTDLLLHDMGEGLADHRPDFLATGREWRTQSLWGIGLTQTVLPYSSYLHDGRARTLEEAILWHDGEAKNSKAQFQAMSQSDRDALIRFLRSL
ncbi:MAG: c-type cytochrome [Cyanobacteria bacterium SBLK]|nr:c-type cytochrome [Cyanobacteria bacterium SBLK]